MSTNKKVRVLATIMLAISVSSFLTIIPVRANFAPLPQQPGTQWVPSGGMADNLQFQVYSDATAEFNAFQSALPFLDIADALVPPGVLSTLQSDSRFLVTGGVPQYNVYGLDFNMANSLWGVPFSNGVDPTGRSVHIRQGIAHLISRSGFISSVLVGNGARADCFTPRLQIQQGRILCPLPSDLAPSNGNIPSWNVCSWDKMFPTCFAASGAYSLGSPSDSTGAVQVGSADFCAAADHFIAAGLATGKDANCVLTGLTSTASQTVTLMVPFKESGKKLRFLGDTLTSAINNLMGPGTHVVECGWSSTGWSDQIPASESVGTPLAQLWLTAIGAGFCGGSAGWHMAVSGWGLSQNIDQFYKLYNSKFSFNAYSNPAFDNWTNMLEFNNTLSGAQQSAQAAEYIMGADAVNIPVWSDAGQFAYLNGWTNVVNQQGVGTPNQWTALNAWNPQQPQTGAIRWGFQESTLKLNVFNSVSYWDRFVLSEIYDTLLAPNPYSPDDLMGWMANQFAVGSPTTGDPAGTVQDIVFNLRNNMFFHDGIQVTANDVKFSFLTLTTAPSGTVKDVLDVTIVNSFNIRVNMAHLSPFTLFNIGSVPIIPQHILAADTSTQCTTKGSLACSVNTSFLSGASDPVSNHLLIGSGAWVCKDLTTGQVGGGCTSSGSSNVDAGGTIVLRRNGLGQAGLAQQAYFRNSAKYKLWQWADVFNHGTVDIIDIGNAADCNNKPDSTTGCIHWDTPAAHVTCTATAGSCNSGSLTPPGGNSDGVVEFTEVSQAFGQFGFSWTQPIAYASLTGAQLIPQTLYEGGITYGPCVLTAPQC